MALKLKITPTAKKDIQEGMFYYNGKQKGLGKRFENQINETFRQIQKMPSSGSFIFENVRYKVVKRFPYIVVYDLD